MYEAGSWCSKSLRGAATTWILGDGLVRREGAGRGGRAREQLWRQGWRDILRGLPSINPVVIHSGRRCVCVCVLWGGSFVVLLCGV